MANGNGDKTQWMVDSVWPIIIARFIMPGAAVIVMGFTGWAFTHFANAIDIHTTQLQAQELLTAKFKIKMETAIDSITHSQHEISEHDRQLRDHDRRIQYIENTFLSPMQSLPPRIPRQP